MPEGHSPLRAARAAHPCRCLGLPAAAVEGRHKLDALNAYSLDWVLFAWFFKEEKSCLLLMSRAAARRHAWPVALSSYSPLGPETPKENQ